MPQNKTIYGNFLQVEDVIDQRLVKLATSGLKRCEGVHPEIAAIIGPPLAEFELERAAVDGSDSEKQQSVSATDDVLSEFKKYMRLAEHGLVWHLKTKESPVYDAFFPNGLDEYGKANKTTMPLLTDRLKKASEKHGAAIPAEIRDRLLGLEAEWDRSFGGQESGKGELEGVRVERTQARIKLELAVLSAIHFIAYKYPGDVDACARFFDLHLIRAPRHSSLEQPADGQ